jgi:hypothetical protein
MPDGFLLQILKETFYLSSQIQNHYFCLKWRVLILLNLLLKLDFEIISFRRVEIFEDPEDPLPPH